MTNAFSVGRPGPDTPLCQQGSDCSPVLGASRMPGSKLSTWCFSALELLQKIPAARAVKGQP